MASIEELFTEFEKAKAESKEAQLRAKEFKEEIINEMLDKGVDEMVINGLDGLVVLEISYPEREVLNKKALADALNVPQKDLSKPQTWIELTQQGKITPEMIEEFTVVEERMQFGTRDYQAGDGE